MPISPLVGGADLGNSKRAGHDCCTIPISREHWDIGLDPDLTSLASLHGVLNDRDGPYDEHTALDA
jgi:hypothetical protein